MKTHGNGILAPGTSKLKMLIMEQSFGGTNSPTELHIRGNNLF